MSGSQELQKIRSGLEEESRRLIEEKKNLEERIKVLREKASIEELRRSNVATRDAISKLKTEMSELEKKVKGTTETPASDGSTKEVVSEKVATFNPEVPPAQPQFDNKQEEKKRKFF